MFKYLVRILSLVIVIGMVIVIPSCILDDDSSSSIDPSHIFPIDFGDDDDDEIDTTELLEVIDQYGSYRLPEDFDPTGLTPQEIVEATKDPYAWYFTEEEYEEYYADLTGNFVGIGVSVDYLSDENYIRLLYVFKGSPAEQAGLQPKDLLTHVDGVEIGTYGYSEAINHILGEAGTTVHLTYLRDGESYEIDVVRAECTKQTVFYRTIESGSNTYGYIHISTFDTITSSEFIQAIDALEAQDVDGFVFDLRFNGGGMLRAVCEMLAYLLPDGTITRLRYEYGYNTTVYAEDGKLNYMGTSLTKDPLGNDLNTDHQINKPVAILTNGDTASASELFTSALLDYGATGEFVTVKTVGEKSYGKGCMQTSFQLSNDDYIKLTVALYDPPFSDNYNDIGIYPTIEVEPTVERVGNIYLQDVEDATLEAAINYLNEEQE